MIVFKTKRPLRLTLKEVHSHPPPPPHYSKRTLDVVSLTPGLTCPVSHLPPGSLGSGPIAENESSLRCSSQKQKSQTHSQRACELLGAAGLEESVWTWMRLADLNNLSDPQFPHLCSRGDTHPLGLL